MHGTKMSTLNWTDSNNSTGGSSEQLTELSTGDDEQWATAYSVTETILITAILLSIIVGTVVGNVLVCIAVCLVSKLRRPCNYLLVSLAVSDLCVSLLVMPMAMAYEILGHWPFGSMMCDTWVAFDVLSCTASILNLCMISVDRYYAITRPLDYGVKRTPRRMCLCVACVWLTAACISLPPLLVLGNYHGTDGMQCTVCQEFGYQIYATLGSFYIPLSVMIAVYQKIFQAAQRIVHEERVSQSHLLAQQQQQQQQEQVADRKTYVHEKHINGDDSLVAGSNRHGSEAPSTASQPVSQVASDAATTTGALVTSNKHSRSRLRFTLTKERKASTTLGIIMSAFTLCWLPFFVLAIVRPFLNTPDLIPQWMSSLFLWLGYTNSFFNPVIYATTNKDFRLPFREILCLRCKSLNSIMREEFYHSQFGDVDRTHFHDQFYHQCPMQNEIPLRQSPYQSPMPHKTAAPTYKSSYL